MFLLISGPLIERIVAVCQTKDDQSSWVEILQKQIRGVRSQSASSTPTHVSEAPYATGLARYFAKLVRDGVLTRGVLKRLLYPELIDAAKVIRVLGIRIRRSHRVECVIFPEPKDATYSFVPSTPDSSPSRSLLTRQNAQDESDSDEGSCDTDPLGYIRYYSPSEDNCKVAQCVSLNFENCVELPKTQSYCSTQYIECTNTLEKPVESVSAQSSFDAPSKENAGACWDLSRLDSGSPLPALSRPLRRPRLSEQDLYTSCQPVGRHRSLPPEFEIKTNAERHAVCLAIPAQAMPTPSALTVSLFTLNINEENEDYFSELDHHPLRTSVYSLDVGVGLNTPARNSDCEDRGEIELRQDSLGSEASVRTVRPAEDSSAAAYCVSLVQSVSCRTSDSGLATSTPPPTPPPTPALCSSPQGIYRSGLYAHWWLKTRIPAAWTVQTGKAHYWHEEKFFQSSAFN